MRSSAKMLITAAILICMIPAAGLALTPYTENFEDLSQASSTALGDAGWLVFANVFDATMGYLYGYGVYPAPNGGGGFSAIASGEGGASQGIQQLVVYNDYNNTDHALGNYIEANLFQEQTVGSGDVGETWVFDFQAKMGDLAGSTTAIAFIKTLNPAAGYATTNFLTVDMTSIPATWNDYVLSIEIDGSLVGQLLQIGFSSTATNYEPSGVFYDNISFGPTGPVAVEDSSWGSVKSLFK